MPIPSSINDLSTTAGSNYPAGTDAPATIDDVLRQHGSYIAILRDEAYNGSARGAVNVSATATTWGSFKTSAVNQSFLTFYKGGTTSEVGFIGTDGGALLGAGPSSVGNNFVIRAQAELVLSSGATESIRIDALQNTIVKTNATAPTLTTDGQMVFSLSGSTLTISARVSGATKTATIALT